MADLDAMVRVRALRARIAEREASSSRQAVARAESAVVAARSLKAECERQATASTADVPFVRDANGASHVALADVHRLLEFTAGARHRANEAVSTIRRAEIARDRIQFDCDEVLALARVATARHTRIADESTRRAAIDRRRREEAASDDAGEEQATTTSALRAKRR